MNTKNEWENEWEKEPSFLEFSYKGYLCQIRRHSSLLNLCGYVVLPKQNKFFGKNYNDIDVEVHGGLTYSQDIGEDFWKIGFDCGHLYDISPGLSPSFLEDKSTYKNIEYVKREIENMVDQIIEKEETND